MFNPFAKLRAFIATEDQKIHARVSSIEARLSASTVALSVELAALRKCVAELEAKLGFTESGS